MFLLQNSRPVQPSPARLRELTFEPVAADSRASKFDLTLSLEENGEGIAGYVEYSLDLFDATTIRRLIQQLAVLLTAAVERPRQPLAELRLMSGPELHPILMALNDTAAPPTP